MHGLGESGLYEEMGINSRMDALQAAALSVKLRHLGGWTKQRRELASRYDLLFASKLSSRLAEGGVDPSDAARRVITPEPVPAPGRHSYHRYVIRVAPESREALIHGLEAEGIASEIYYPMGLHQQPALVRYQAEAPAPVIQNEDEFPETLRATREALALPLYPELSTDDLERIVDTVVRILGTF
jgi:dTDP-4-amino-4,6-dideoxygalactose transaminase